MEKGERSQWCAQEGAAETVGDGDVPAQPFHRLRNRPSAPFVTEAIERLPAEFPPSRQ